VTIDRDIKAQAVARAESYFALTGKYQTPEEFDRVMWGFYEQLATPKRRLLSARAAAKVLGVDKSTVSRWCTAGKLPAHQTQGGHWRIRTVDVEALVKERQHP
jgi:excisionase family DNA binding protein